MSVIMELSSATVENLSAVIGWTYVLLWAASFYPQFFLNLQRKTTHGFSIDFALLNVLGMTAYAIHNGCFFWSPTIRDQYARRHPSSPTPTVQANDVAYGIHGAFITSIVYSQFYPYLWKFTPIKDIKASTWCLVLFWGCILMAAIGSIAVVHNPHSSNWMWLDVIYLFGNIKALLTVLKYTPQVYLNWQRQSTEGLSMTQFTLDFIGAILSILQLVIDSVHAGDWSAMFANPAKLALGNVTLLFDSFFFFQHFVLYRHAWEKAEENLPRHRPANETDPLLARQTLPPSSGKSTPASDAAV